MLSSALCISRLTGLSHPIRLLGPNRVLRKPSLPRVGLPQALYMQMEAQFFPRKTSPILMLQSSEDLVPPWPRGKGSAGLSSAVTPFVACRGADSPFGELSLHPCSATCVPPKGGPGDRPAAPRPPHVPQPLVLGTLGTLCQAKGSVPWAGDASQPSVPGAAASPSTAPLPMSEPPLCFARCCRVW